MHVAINAGSQKKSGSTIRF